MKILKKHDLLLFTGGGATGRSNAAVARDLAVELGVSPARCLLEEESQSTIQSAAHSAELFRKTKSHHHPVLVSDPYELPRARRLFERYAKRTVSTSPVLNSPRHVVMRERIRWTLRELPQIMKDLVFTR